MTIPDSGYRAASREVYDVDGERAKYDREEGQLKKGDTYKDEVTNQKYYILDTYDNDKNGLQAMAVAPIVNGKTDTSQVVVAYAGTDTSDIQDLAEDGFGIGLGQEIRLGSDFLFTSSQAVSARKYAQKIQEQYPEATVSYTGHSLGGSTAMYVALKEGADSVTFNAPDIFMRISLAEAIYIRTHRGQFRNYRVEQDIIGGITGDLTDSAIYVDMFDGAFDLGKITDYHSISQWRFDKDGNLIDRHGKRVKSKRSGAKAQAHVAANQYGMTFLRHQLSKRAALSASDLVFLDSFQALSFLPLLEELGEEAYQAMVREYNQGIDDLMVIWDSRFSVAGACPDLSEAEIEEAYAEAGFTFSHLMTDYQSHFEPALDQADELGQRVTALSGQVHAGITELERSDGQLATLIGLTSG